MKKDNFDKSMIYTGESVEEIELSIGESVSYLIKTLLCILQREKKIKIKIYKIRDPSNKKILDLQKG